MKNTSTDGRDWALVTTGDDNGEGVGAFLIRDNDVLAVRMMIDTDGAVGIGTITPATVITNSKLDVVGGHIAVSNNYVVFRMNADGGMFTTGGDFKLPGTIGQLDVNTVTCPAVITRSPAVSRPELVRPDPASAF